MPPRTEKKLLNDSSCNYNKDPDLTSFKADKKWQIWKQKNDIKFHPNKADY